MLKKLAKKDQYAGCEYCNYVGCGWSRNKHGEKLGHWVWVGQYSYNRLTKAILESFRDMFKTKLDYSKISDVEVENINFKDSPDFSDAYIFSATYKNRAMSEKELEILNEDSDFVYEQVLKTIY